MLMKQNVRKHSSSLHLKPRPTSTTSTTNLQKKPPTKHHPTRSPSETDLFMGVYKGNKFTSDLLAVPEQQPFITYRGESMDIANIMRLKGRAQNVGRSCKTVEELLQENLQIKEVNNQLKCEIMRLRGRAVGTKANSLKELEIEYEKDIYWANNQQSHRVQGMKQQYEKLKRQYERQKKELADLKKAVANTGQTELQIYIKHLQNQNNVLISHLKTTTLNPTSPTPIKPSSTSYSKPITNTTLIPTPLPYPYPDPQQLNRIKCKLKQKEDQIVFLERSLIGKGNAEHHALCKVRKLKKENQEILGLYNRVVEERNVMGSRLEIQKIKIKSYFNQEINQIKRDLTTQITQRDHKIRQLEQELKKNTQILGNKSKINAPNITKSLINANRSNLRKSSHDFHNLRLLIKQQDENEFEMTQSRRFASNPHQQNQSNFNSSKSEILRKTNPVRQPRRANKKYDQSSCRMRRVQFNQVQAIGELLKFRMIGLRVQPGQIKDYFMRKDLYTEESDRTQSKKSDSFFQVIEKVQKQQQRQWEDEYINMKQVETILKSSPFLLNQSQAHLLSRYLIQDCDDEYVYCSNSNQNKRQITKSITKALIGPYTLPTLQQQKNLQKTLQKFRPNLTSTLKTYYPQGFIPKQKLIETAIGIGMEPTQKEKDIIVGLACLGVDSLGGLDYMRIFQG